MPASLPPLALDHPQGEKQPLALQSQPSLPSWHTRLQSQLRGHQSVPRCLVGPLAQRTIMDLSLPPPHPRQPGACEKPGGRNLLAIYRQGLSYAISVSSCCRCYYYYYHYSLEGRALDCGKLLVSYPAGPAMPTLPRCGTVLLLFPSLLLRSSQESLL